MSVRPTATRGVNEVRLIFPYDPIMVEELKVQIPAHARTYESEMKVWTVREPYVGRAIALLQRCFPHATVAGGRARQSASAPPSKQAVTTPHATLFLVPGAPPEVIDAAYRALVKLHHPDRLPHTEKADGNATLARINVAYAQLTAGRKAS